MARWTFSQFASSQWAPVPPVATGDMTNKTVVLIGANAGIGFEAAKHFAQMNPGKLILACRSAERGDTALRKLKEETGFERAEVRIVDLAELSSVIQFTKELNEQEERVDVLVQNAGVLPELQYVATKDGWETTLQVNHIAPSLMSILLLPKMFTTAENHNTRPCLVLVSSGVHMMSKFDKDLLEKDDLLKLFGSQEYCTPGILEKRYCDTKLLNLLFVRALNERLPNSSVVVNCVDPGFCYSDLRKPETMTGLGGAINWAREKIFAHTAEEGSRQIVFASVGGEKQPLEDLRGAYISNSAASEPSDYVLGKEGQEAQDHLWADLMKEMVVIEPQVQEVAHKYLTEPVNLE